MKKYRLTPDQLTCNIPIEELRFETTEDLTPLYEMIGQDRAAKAMEFGLSIKKRGYNIMQQAAGELEEIHMLDT